ncbi:hypothetical protein WN943_005994 [Citrus x changshan-huyou]
MLIENLTENKVVVAGGCDFEDDLMAVEMYILDTRSRKFDEMVIMK